MKSKEILAAAISIHSVEARHASYLNLINGVSPFPDAFDMGKKPSEIVTANVSTVPAAPTSSTWAELGLTVISGTPVVTLACTV